jgi:hypothetical protein
MSLLYQLPEDGMWVRFVSTYTFQMEGIQQRGEQTMRTASVGEVLEGGDPRRWIEFKIEENQNGVDLLWIRKLLIPIQYLNHDQNPTLHVVRGWTMQENGVVEPAVPVHGRWPAFLSGPLNDENRLPKQIVDSGLGLLECEGIYG